MLCFFPDILHEQSHIYRYLNALVVMVTEGNKNNINSHSSSTASRPAVVFLLLIFPIILQEQAIFLSIQLF